MASSDLFDLYSQIESSTNSFEIIGADPLSTQTEIREKYHAIALIIHPDKASGDHLREHHTALFQVVQRAYADLIKNHSDGVGDRDDDNLATPKRSTDFWASLSARNKAFRQALAHEREEALKAQPKPGKRARRAERRKAQTKEDFELVTTADAKLRCQKQLLSGGRHGSVSLIGKQQRDDRAAGKCLRHTLELGQGTDEEDIIHSGLTTDQCRIGRVAITESIAHTNTERALALQAFDVVEKMADEMTESALAQMPRDVVERHVLPARPLTGERMATVIPKNW